MDSEVLVYGATGAIGSAAVQLLTSLGAHVTAVCSSEHVALVAGLGADRVVDRTTTDFLADTQPYDLVFDAVGKCSFLERIVDAYRYVETEQKVGNVVILVAPDGG